MEHPKDPERNLPGIGDLSGTAGASQSFEARFDDFGMDQQGTLEDALQQHTRRLHDHAGAHKAGHDEIGRAIELDPPLRAC